MFCPNPVSVCLKHNMSPQTHFEQRRGKQGSNLQDSDVAFLSAQVEAGLPRVVRLIDVGPQTDQIGYHQVVVLLGCIEEGGLQTEGH